MCDTCVAHRKTLAASPAKKEYVKNWRQNNRDKMYAYTKKWNTANREKRKQVVNSWRNRNPDKIKQINKKAGAKWAKNNKGLRGAISRRRQIALINRTPAWADHEKINIIYMECEKITKETGVPHEVDHVIPLQGQYISGLHVHDNLQIIERSKNRSKQNKFIQYV